MELISRSLEKYAKSGEYFQDARKWYAKKYIFPIYERSILILIISFFGIIIAGLLLNIKALLPLKVELKYLSEVKDIFNKKAIIKQASLIEGEPLTSIAIILVQNYVTNREKYDYAKLRNQITFVKNNSTNALFKEFYDNLSLTNTNSPVLRYQRLTKRYIQPISYKILGNDRISITFRAWVEDEKRDIIEDHTWEAQTTYTIDEINARLPPGSRFGFSIKEYNLKFIKNNKAN